MRIASRLVSVACIVSLCAPVAADAAIAPGRKPLRLRDIVRIIEKNSTKNLGFNGEITAMSGRNKITIGLATTQNSQIQNLTKAAGDATMTIDAVSEDGSTAHGVIEMRLVNAVIYLRLSDVRITGPMAEMEDALAPYADTWISLPLDEGIDLANSQSRMSSAAIARLEQYFAIEETVGRGTTRYTVTLPKAKVRRFLMAFLRSSKPTYISPSELRAVVRLTKIDFTMTLDVVNNAFSQMTNDLTVTSTIDGRKGTITFKGTTKTLRSAPIIVAPASSTPLEDLMFKTYSIEEEESQYRLASARNAQRKSEVNVILNATYQYAIDHDGELPATLTAAPQMICATNASCAGVSLDILTGSYLVRLPMDPDLTYGESDETGYTILRDSNDRITVSAPLAENGASISVTR